MKETLILLSTLIINFSSAFTQDFENINFTLNSEAYFDIKPDYRKSNTTEEASVIIFKISITNIGATPIPDLGATQRSEHLNFIVNDSIQNPLCLYNGTEIIGDHLLKNGESAIYEWWIYADDAYGEIFTVQWEYIKELSSKHKIDSKTKRITLLTK